MTAFRQRNGLRAFHHNPYSTRIDLPVYFHTVMDGIVPPPPLLVQIITNQYVLKAPHQNIILTHDLFPLMPRSPSNVRESMVGCSVTDSLTALRDQSKQSAKHSQL